MNLIVFVKIWDNFAKLINNVIMSCHICSKNAANHSFPNFFVRFTRKISKYITFWIFKNAKCYGAVVILQRRDIIITKSQFSLCIDLFREEKIFQVYKIRRVYFSKSELVFDLNKIETYLINIIVPGMIQIMTYARS